MTELAFDPSRALEYQAAAVREKCMRRTGLRAFIRTFWPAASGGREFDPDFDWYADAMADHLMAVSARVIGNLVINASPGTGKSTIVSILWPCWHWALEPRHTWMSTSYSDPLVNRWADARAAVMQDELFRAAFPAVAFLPGGQKKYQRNANGGTIIGLPLNGPGTGSHVRTQICDDPHNVGDKDSELKKEQVKSKWHGALATRTFDPVDFRRVVNQQRLAADDLAGTCLDAGYEHLCLPMRYYPNAFWDRGSTLTRARKYDPRTDAGTPLKNEEWALARERDLTSPRDRSAQLDQNPAPDTGGIIEKGWIRRCGWELLGDLNRLRWMQSWDFGFKGKEAGHSRVVGGLFAADPGTARVFWVRNTKPDHLNYPQSKAVCRAVNGMEVDTRLLKPGHAFTPADLSLWARARLKLIEDKANGPAIMDDLAEEIQGFQPVEPEGNKEERLIRHSDSVRSGCLYILDDNEFATDIVDELVAFPMGSHDDLVDICTQALDAVFSPFARRPEQLKTMLQKLQALELIDFGG